MKIANKSFLGFSILFFLLVTSCLGAKENEEKANSSSLLSTEEASQMVLEAVKTAKNMGYNVSATVIDKDGIILATLRSEKAYPHTPSTSFKKAFTALVAKERTSQLVAEFTSGEVGKGKMIQFTVKNLNQSDKIILLGGGVPLKNKEGNFIGAIGVGGAPSGDLDDEIIHKTLKSLNY